MEDEWREKGAGRNKGGIKGRKGENVREMDEEDKREGGREQRKWRGTERGREGVNEGNC